MPNLYIKIKGWNRNNGETKQNVFNLYFIDTDLVKKCLENRMYIESRPWLFTNQ